MTVDRGFGADMAQGHFDMVHQNRPKSQGGKF